jgi:SAM-dependent methyltransferase
MLLFDSLDPSTRPAALADAIRTLSQNDETERGAVFTRGEIVETILDLAGYDSSRPLHRLRLLEPACGGGDFLVPALDRLLAAYAAAGGSPQSAAIELRNALCAVEIHPASLATTERQVRDRLARWGAPPGAIDTLCRAWLRADDFLLTPLSGLFDFVIGNPPYVRIERIPAVLMAEYRRRYHALYDRADLYVAFYDRGLDLLAPDGRLAFICANRWIKNRYGGPLRERIAGGFHVEHVIDLEGADAFHSEVDAYPAITVISRPLNGTAVIRMTRVVSRPELGPDSLARLACALRSDGPASDTRIQEIPSAELTGEPWLLDGGERLALLRRLAERYPELESAGCRVGIGVATGYDAAFIGDFDKLPVEAERKVPLSMASDLDHGVLHWEGRGVVNPFEADGSLADLTKYPRFGAFIRSHEGALRARHCARKNPSGWYRTIDRIWPELVQTPKLLIPDIKGESVVVFDEGRYYPHHNLYFVTSQTWDLRALQAVLRSSIALWLVAAYCVRMAGGFLRFQAQYLRRIRLPTWESVPPRLRQALVRASETTNLTELDSLVFDLYGFSTAEAEIVRDAASAARVRPAKQSRRRAA